MRACWRKQRRLCGYDAGAITAGLAGYSNEVRLHIRSAVFVSGTASISGAEAERVDTKGRRYSGVERCIGVLDQCGTGRVCTGGKGATGEAAVSASPCWNLRLCSHSELPLDGLLGCGLRLCRNGNNFRRAFSHTVSLLPII